MIQQAVNMPYSFRFSKPAQNKNQMSLKQRGSSQPMFVIIEIPRNILR